MTDIKRKIIGGVVALIVTFSSYTAGSIFGQKTALRNFVKQYKSSEIRVSYGRYLHDRDISVAIDEQKYDYAKCSADLGASSLYDDLTECLANKECVKTFGKADAELTPELFDKTLIEFKYYPLQGDIRSCDKKN